MTDEGLKIGVGWSIRWPGSIKSALNMTARLPKSPKSASLIAGMVGIRWMSVQSKHRQDCLGLVFLRGMTRDYL